MKKTINLIVPLTILMLCACSKEEAKEATKTTESEIKEVAKKIEEKVIDKLEPKTISLQEVSRIALVEAKQFISLVAEKAPDTDVTKINELYSQAETLFDSGEFKQAQQKAVEVRHAVEEVLIEVKKNLN